MTPTEQDKGLRLEIARKVYPRTTIGEIMIHGSPEVVLDNYSESPIVYALANFITADRKRVALEARIDEINYLDDNFQADSQDWEREHPGYSTAMIPMEDYIRRRTELTKLEAEL